MSTTIIIIMFLSILYFLKDRKATEFTKEDKKEYMTSFGWRMKREAVLRRDNSCCQSCGATERLEVHHITYKRLGNEDLGDLIVVCRNCHQKIHDRYGYNYQSFFPLIKK